MSGRVGLGYIINLNIRRFIYLNKVLDPDDILIRNFPSEASSLTALLGTLFQKDGAAGIRGKCCGSRQDDVTSTIKYVDLAIEKI